ncbi:carbonic anhydrase-like [Anneissia japonica]|uniref:carbonic anhydrase-like n=1 Tax=Anneissia japonica TaxID=1529436 RepID=UPI001425A3AD|nr:carbonic anhydrase-like [Anneissia japonica]
MSWGYTKENGPDTWHKEFPIANGKRQSPIDINTAQVQYDSSLGNLKLHYDPKSVKNVSNNGHTFTVAFNQSDLNDLSGGPLKDKYELAQFHCHWGSRDDVGSEHTVNGSYYASELHLVHWNTTKFKSVGDAIKSDSGIAVLGTFIKVGKEHPYWAKILPYLSKVAHKNQSADIHLDGGFDVSKILPNNTNDYYTYEGSLTTPPLYESVSWIVFKEPIEISEAQMAQFRALMTSEEGSSGPDCCMVNNYRPTMPLNGRVVKSSFQ